jgi:hypothetical protein
VRWVYARPLWYLSPKRLHVGDYERLNTTINWADVQRNVSLAPVIRCDDTRILVPHPNLHPDDNWVSGVSLVDW